MTKKMISTLVLLAATCALLYAASAPTVTVDSSRHGNLASAQQSIVAAWQSINTAQQENRNHLGGHAEKAKDLLNQANQEIQYAANSADNR
ncbi:MAG: hypothetical protein JST79_16090 [Acidobacteria bacterium]|nr:hypothetical protein [Acidobacteriota bacterium]